MKDAQGHGSDAHTSGIAKIGKIALHPNAINVVARTDGSVKPTTGKVPASGYMVSIPGHTQIVDARALNGPGAASIISTYANNHADALADPKAHIGRWQEPGTNKVYLDVSHNIRSRDAAIKTGVAHNQKAIWDLKHGREINTGGTGE
jgi:hypothetical protein